MKALIFVYLQFLAFKYCLFGDVSYLESFWGEGLGKNRIKNLQTLIAWFSPTCWKQILFHHCAPFDWKHHFQIQMYMRAFILHSFYTKDTNKHRCYFYLLNCVFRRISCMKESIAHVCYGSLCFCTVGKRKPPVQQECIACENWAYFLKKQVSKWNLTGT